MNDSLLLYAVSSKLLERFQPPQLGAFSAWLHFEREWNESDRDSVSSLISGGCRSILVTGNSSSEVHDLVDDVAYALTEELVLTSFAARADQDAAFDFITTRCPGAEPAFFLLAVFSIDARFETIALAENLKLVGLEMTHP